MVPTNPRLVGEKFLIGGGRGTRWEPELCLYRLFREVGSKTQSKDSIQIGVEEGGKLGGELSKEIEAPLVSRSVAALYKMIIVFVGREAVGAAVVIPGFSSVKSSPHREFFPAKLREEGP